MHLIKQIFRSILKFRMASLFSIFSLVTAFLCIIIITLYVSFEKSFDQFHTNNSSIYRVETSYSAWIPAIAADVIKENIPEVVNVTSIWNRGKSKFATEKMNLSDQFVSTDALYASDEFLRMFSFPLIIGDKNTVLIEPGNVVITESLSKKLFGKENAYGKTITINKAEFMVSGIMHDLPNNSTIQSDCLISFSTLTRDARGKIKATKSWSEWSYNVFIQARKGIKPKKLVQKISQIDQFDKKLEGIKERNPNKEPLSLRPLKELHYASSYWGKSNKLILNILSILGFMIMCMGFVNFINFSTSQASNRAKALSIQQVLGGKKQMARIQVILESIILSLISIIVAIAIHFLIYPTIESFFEIKGLSFESRPIYLIWFFILSISFGVLASLYPSNYFNSAPISEVIKGKIFFVKKGKAFRNALIIIQFVFAIGLIISTLIIEKQLHFWKNFDLGIDKEHVVCIRTTKDLREHHQAFADELMKSREILDYTYSNFIPGQVGMGWGREIDGQYVNIKCWPIDHHFLDFFKIKIAEGRSFNPNSQADINTFIINRKAAEEFGWENPLEHQMGGFDFLGDIIGVAENFNFSRLQDEIMPMQFWLTNKRKYVLMLRVQPQKYQQTVTYIKNIAQKFDSTNQIDVKFLDDQLNALYTKEEKIARFIEFITLWCVILAMFGILGLSFFIGYDKTKEIGIRKVNGAKTHEIIKMLNLDFLKWIAIAYLIACPLAYLAMNKWLENFAYRTELSWWVFVLAGIITMGIALLTVSFQSYRAATRNPVESLRYE